MTFTKIAGTATALVLVLGLWATERAGSGKAERTAAGAVDPYGALAGLDDLCVGTQRKVVVAAESNALRAIDPQQVGIRWRPAFHRAPAPVQTRLAAQREAPRGAVGEAIHGDTQAVCASPGDGSALMPRRSNRRRSRLASGFAVVSSFSP